MNYKGSLTKPPLSLSSSFLHFSVLERGSRVVLLRPGTAAPLWFPSKSAEPEHTRYSQADILTTVCCCSETSHQPSPAGCYYQIRDLLEAHGHCNTPAPTGRLLLAGAPQAPAGVHSVAAAGQASEIPIFVRLQIANSQDTHPKFYPYSQCCSLEQV